MTDKATVIYISKLQGGDRDIADPNPFDIMINSYKIPVNKRRSFFIKKPKEASTYRNKFDTLANKMVSHTFQSRE